jgi:hypothetical protein
MIHNPPCQSGQTTREEYRVGIHRPMCSRPAVVAVERRTAGGTTYVVHLCADHAETN